MSLGQFVAWGESGTFCHLGQFVAQKMPVGQFVVGTKCLLTAKIPSNLKRDTNLFDKRMMGGYIAIQSLPHRGQHHQEEDQDLSDRGTKPDLLEKKAASSEDSK